MFGISLVTVKRNPEKGFEEEANLKKQTNKQKKH